MKIVVDEVIYGLHSETRKRKYEISVSHTEVLALISLFADELAAAFERREKE